MRISLGFLSDEMFSIFSKPNWIWFGINFPPNSTQLFSKPNWIWFGNICQFLEDNFLNQTGFGLETDTE